MTTDRIYQADDEPLWYFSVRGNQARGPFDSYDAAQAALSAHVAACNRRLGGNLRWPRMFSSQKARRNRTISQARHT
jgi:hypothetical protein